MRNEERGMRRMKEKRRAKGRRLRLRFSTRARRHGLGAMAITMVIHYMGLPPYHRMLARSNDSYSYL